MVELKEMRDNLAQMITAFINNNATSLLEDFDIHKYDKMSRKEKRESGRFLTKDKALVDNIQHLLDDRHLFNVNTLRVPVTSDISETSETSETEQQ